MLLTLLSTDALLTSAVSNKKSIKYQTLENPGDKSIVCCMLHEHVILHIKIELMQSLLNLVQVNQVNLTRLWREIRRH